MNFIYFLTFIGVFNLKYKKTYIFCWILGFECGVIKLVPRQNIPDQISLNQNIPSKIFHDKTSRVKMSPTKYNIITVAIRSNNACHEHLTVLNQII